MTVYPTLEQVLDDCAVMGLKVRDPGLLDSALHRPRSAFGGTEVYASVPLKAAALLHSLIRNHPLVDGNKRLAWLVTVVFLDLNGWRSALSNVEAAELVLRLVVDHDVALDQIEAGLDELLATIRKGVAIDVYRHVLNVRDAVVFTLQHAGDRYQADPDFYSVRQTAMTYLPEALSRYLALPRAYAEQERLSDGKTAHDTPIEQLALMETNTRRVADTIVERESQRLITHGRFLSERLGQSSLDPTRPVVVATPQPVASQVPVEARVEERQLEREKVRVV